MTYCINYFPNSAVHFRNNNTIYDIPLRIHTNNKLYRQNKEPSREMHGRDKKTAWCNNEFIIRATRATRDWWLTVGFDLWYRFTLCLHLDNYRVIAHNASAQRPPLAFRPGNCILLSRISSFYWIPGESRGIARGGGEKNVAGRYIWDGGNCRTTRIGNEYANNNMQTSSKPHARRKRSKGEKGGKMKERKK